MFVVWVFSLTVLPPAAFAKQSSEDSDSKSSQASDDTIRIYLSKGYGTYAGRRFSALGGRNSHPTPTGSFTVKTKDPHFYSRKYKAPMPYSVFFTSQAAIHTGSLEALSHGCIHVGNYTAQYIYKNAEPGRTKVVVYP